MIIEYNPESVNVLINNDFIKIDKTDVPFTCVAKETKPYISVWFSDEHKQYSFIKDTPVGSMARINGKQFKVSKVIQWNTGNKQGLEVRLEDLQNV